jgi:hypothetical protein
MTKAHKKIVKFITAIYQAEGHCGTSTKIIERGHTICKDNFCERLCPIYTYKCTHKIAYDKALEFIGTCPEDFMEVLL